MTTLLPKDADNNVIPVMRFRTGGAHTIAATTSSARNVTAFDAATKVVSLYATGPVYVRFGTSSVSAAATDHYFPEGIYYDVAIGGDQTGHSTHVAVLAASTSCSVYLSEKE